MWNLSAGVRHIMLERRAAARLVALDALEAEFDFGDGEASASKRYSVLRLLERIYRFKLLDRQVILLVLERERAASMRRSPGFPHRWRGVRLNPRK